MVVTAMSYASRFDRFSFPSTGDPERDAQEAEKIRRREARLSEGMCPNGCATPMELDTPTERHCPDCGFTQGSNVPFR